MDEAFFLRAKRLLEQRAPAPLDHRRLVDEIVARQAASPTARACINPRSGVDPTQAIAALILADVNWRPAAQALRGCFNRAVAVRRVNTP